MQIGRGTYISVSLVIVACSVSYKVGSAQSDNKSLVARVEAIEVRSEKDNASGNAFQKEVVDRLARIETALKLLLEGK